MEKQERIGKSTDAGYNLADRIITKILEYQKGHRTSVDECHAEQLADHCVKFLAESGLQESQELAEELASAKWETMMSVCEKYRHLDSYQGLTEIIDTIHGY